MRNYKPLSLFQFHRICVSSVLQRSSLWEDKLQNCLENLLDLQMLLVCLVY